MSLSKDTKTIIHTPSCLRHIGVVPGVYDSIYDSYYCEICNRWLEKPCLCGGDDCEYFPNRPNKPIGVKVA